MSRFRLGVLLVLLAAGMLGCAWLAVAWTGDVERPVGEHTGPVMEAHEATEPTRRHVTAPPQTAEPGPPVRRGVGTAADDVPPLVVLRENSTVPEEGAVLLIRIIDGAGRPRVDVDLSVTANTESGRRSVFSGSPSESGSRIEGLHAGRAALRATDGTLTRTAVVRLEREVVHRVDLVVPRGARVWGRIRHHRLGELGGVQVVARGERERPTPTSPHDELRATTDATGRYVFPSVPRGRYVVRVSGGRAGQPLQPQGTLEISSSAPVRRDVLIGVPALTGVVTDAVTHVPLARAEVIVKTPHLAMARTDDDGRYEVVDLMPGSQLVQISQGGYVTQQAAIDVDPAEGPVRHDVELSPHASLTLRLRTAAGEAITAATWARTAPGDGTSPASRWLQPDDDGEVTLERLAPGACKLTLRVDGFQQRGLSVRVTTAPSSIDVELLPLPKIVRGTGATGVVTHAESGAPLGGVSVYAAALEEPAETETDAEGRFELRWEKRGARRLVVERDGFGSQLVDVPEDGLLEVALRPAATLVLQVRDGDDEPLSCELGIRPIEHEPNGTVYGGLLWSNEEGVATCRRLVPGRYVLEIDSPDFADSVRLEIHLSLGRNVADVRFE